MRITTRKTISMVTGQVWEHEYFEYIGPLALMCGASQEQKDIEKKQAAYYDVMTQQATQVFGQASSVFKDLQAAFEPIVAAGPNQEGFSEPEKTALNTQATQQVGDNYKKAQQAVGAQLDARGGGNAFLPSGGEQELHEQVGESAANQISSLQNQIVESDYSTGRQNFFTAANALGGATGTFNPASTMSNSATGAGGAAASTANEISQANNSWVSAVTGMAGGILGSVATGGMSNLGKGAGFFGGNAPAPCHIAAATFNGWFDPRTIVVRHWLCTEFASRRYGRIVMKLYVKFGERVAKVPFLVRACRPLIMSALNKSGWRS